MNVNHQTQLLPLGSVCLLNTDTIAMRVFERKVLCQIFGPVRVSDDIRTLPNIEQYELIDNIDVCAGSAMSFEWRRMLCQVFDAVMEGPNRGTEFRKNSVSLV